MTMKFRCQKCGKPMEVDVEQLQPNAGGVIELQHEVCPTENTLPTYRVRVLLERLPMEANANTAPDSEWETLLMVAERKSGPSLVDTFSQLWEGFDPKWQRAVSMLSTIEEEHYYQQEGGSDGPERNAADRP